MIESHSHPKILWLLLFLNVKTIFMIAYSTILLTFIHICIQSLYSVFSIPTNNSLQQEVS